MLCRTGAVINGLPVCVIKENTGLLGCLLYTYGRICLIMLAKAGGTVQMGVVDMISLWVMARTVCHMSVFFCSGCFYVLSLFSFHHEILVSGLQDCWSAVYVFCLQITCVLTC